MTPAWVVHTGCEKPRIDLKCPLFPDIRQQQHRIGQLGSVDLGPSDDPEADADERISSCVVEATDAGPKATKEPRRDVALEALKEAIYDYGERMPGTSAIPPGVKAVRIEQWLSRWRLRTGDDYSSDDSAKTVFRREGKALVERGVVGCAGKLVWINSA